VEGVEITLRPRPLKEEIIARGHPNITASHYNTFQITKESSISRQADCVIGVEADKSISELSEEIKKELGAGKELKIILKLPDYGVGEEIHAVGAPSDFSHPTDIVVRKSYYVCSRTLAIKADKAAKDISREMVELLKLPDTLLVFEILVF
jgi:hypothetical protein